jgi:hypothetical protein
MNVSLLGRSRDCGFATDCTLTVNTSVSASMIFPSQAVRETQKAVAIVTFTRVTGLSLSPRCNYFSGNN